MSYDSARPFDRTTPPMIVTLVALAGLPAMNMNVFMSSMPAMTEAFSTEYAVMQLSISLYLAVTAIVQLFVGPISDRLGRRQVVLVSLSIFVLASLGCALAQSIEAFLAFRMIQAAVAVGMVLSRAMVRDVVPQDEAASTLGYVTMGMSLVPMLAPMIGGHIDEWFGWRAIFYFLAAVGALLILVCWTDMGETNKAQSKSFRDQIRDYPELFRSPRFWGYTFAAAFSSGAFFAFLGGSPYVATEVYGLPPTETRYLFGVPAIGYFAGNYFSGRYSARFGVNRMVTWGTLLLIFGMGTSLLVTLAGYGSAFSFFGFCIFVGLGNGLVLPNANAGLLSVRPRLAGTAAGVGGAIMIGGGAALAALAGALLEFGWGSFPLQWVMFLSSCMSLACISFVKYRARVLAAG